MARGLLFLVSGFGFKGGLKILGVKLHSCCSSYRRGPESRGKEGMDTGIRRYDGFLFHLMQTNIRSGALDPAILELET